MSGKITRRSLTSLFALPTTFAAREITRQLELRPGKLAFGFAGPPAR